MSYEAEEADAANNHGQDEPETCPYCDLTTAFHKVEGDKLRCLPDRQVGLIKACQAITAGEFVSDGQMP